MKYKQSDWERIEMCACGKNSICKLNNKDGSIIYLCWDCFFKLGKINE